MMSTYDRTTSWAILLAAALIRILVGFQPHSGQDNHHGSKVAYGGDFEAQRHWLELTWSLPLGEWYWYDLDYWGLDYPPLTAYVSWMCAYFSNSLVGPESVALETSRGLEDPTHKAFMRGTVLALEFLIYVPVVWHLTIRRNKQYWAFLIALTQPAIILIDHGHFQYNTVALGFSLWAVYFISLPGVNNLVVGSIFFCMALSFKQMTLYYAPVVGCYLLGRCFADRKYAVRRFLLLGVTVVSTVALLWGPVVVRGPEETSYLQRLRHVLRRVFPLQRGLFEGKVSNIWCALSVKPFRIRERIPENYQFMAALLLTAVLMAPSCLRVFRLGLAPPSQANRTLLFTATTNCALVFFLASFQVHEKSLLLALAPASLLPDESLVRWFSLVTAWTLWPLLVVDRLQLAYFCVVGIFVGILLLKMELCASPPSGILSGPWLRRIPLATYALMVSLHAAESLVEPGPALPDLFPVLWSVAGCGLCGIAYLLTAWKLFAGPVKIKDV